MRNHDRPSPHEDHFVRNIEPLQKSVEGQIMIAYDQNSFDHNFKSRYIRAGKLTIFPFVVCPADMF